MKPPVDFVVIAPLREERDAVLAGLPGYERQPASQETIGIFDAAEVPVVFPDGSSARYSVVVTSLVEMGQKDATSATADAIRQWHPRYVLLVGIAGGFAEADVHPGDILIAEQIVDYERAKVRARGTNTRWKAFVVDQRLLLASKNFRSDGWYQSASAERPVLGLPKVHFGTVCSGDKVVARKAFADQLGNTWAKLIGFEMEGAGCAIACSQAAKPPGLFMVRGVSDLADYKKDSKEVQRWRPYARSIAATYAIEFLKSGPVPVSPSSEESKFVNPPVMVAPSYFQGRQEETKRIGDFIKDASLRVMIITGRGGTGKTAMVCRLLESIERGQMPYKLGPLAVDGIVYLSQIGSHKINVPNVFGDLCRLLPASTATRLENLYRDPMRSTRDKLYLLLECFQRKPVIVLLDNLDNLLNSKTRTVVDGELQETLQAILEAPAHAVKILITTRIVPANLPEPGRQRTIFLNEGLVSSDVKNALRALDADDAVGLKTAPDDVLKKVFDLTLGFPRALEAFYGILASDYSITLNELLDQSRHKVPCDVIAALVGEAYAHLNRAAQMVMQALAVYGRPVPAQAVEYLLKFRLKVGSATEVLSQLVNMHFVRKELGRYYLHPVDLTYALDRVPEGTPADRNKTTRFTRLALRHRAADYFKQARLARSNWKNLSDLEPQISEFELRCVGQEYETAASLLNEIDSDFLRRWGHYEEVVTCRKQLLGHLDNEQTRANNLASLGRLHCLRGRLDEGIDLLRQSVDTIHRVRTARSDRTNEPKYLDYLATAYMDRARFREAIHILNRAIAMTRLMNGRDARKIESVCVGRRGVAQRCLGKVRSAIRDEEESLRIATTHRFPDRMAVELGSLGTSYRDLAQFDKAIEYYEKALRLARRVRERRREAIWLAFLGITFRHLGEFRRVEECCTQSLEICQEIGDLRHEAICNGNLAFTHYAQGHIEESVLYHEKALRSARTIKDPRSICYALTGLGAARIAFGDVQQATYELKEAVGMDVPEISYQAQLTIGIAHLHSNARALARRAFINAKHLCHALLKLEPRLFAPRYGLATALVGLAVSDSGWTKSANRTRLLSPALQQYNRATDNCPALGVILTVRRDLELLSKVCPTGLDPCFDILGKG